MRTKKRRRVSALIMALFLLIGVSSPPALAEHTVECETIVIFFQLKDVWCWDEKGPCKTCYCMWIWASDCSSRLTCSCGSYATDCLACGYEVE
jgi:hypothetical protein